jgi:hypothetical protein
MLNKPMAVNRIMPGIKKLLKKENRRYSVFIPNPSPEGSVINP